MKKLLLSLFAAALTVSIHAQTEVLFDFDNNATELFGIEGRSTSSTNDGDITEPVTATVDGVSLTVSKSTTNTANRLWTSSPVLLIYGGTLTIEAPGKLITGIAITQGKWNDKNEFDSGTFASNIWTADSNVERLVLTIAGNTQLKKMVITVVEAGEDVIAKPVASVSSGTYYEAQTVELTCATEGATIIYQIDGEGFEPYTEPIVITNSCVLEAKAVKDGKESDIATYNYVIAKVNTISVEEALAIIEGLNDKETTTDMYIVAGVVESINQNFGTSYGTAEFTLEGGLVAYRLNYLDNQPEKVEDKLHVGDEVVVKGLLQKYGTTPEIVKGYVVEHKVSSVAVEKAKASVASGTYYEAQTVELTCETEGAVIMYQIDENDFQQYSAPLTIAESCALNVYAQKGETKSEVATYNYVIKSLPTNKSLLTNGGFEEWEKDENDNPVQATNWKSASTASNAKVSQSTDAHSGSYAALCTATSSNTRLAYQEITVPEGNYYIVFYAKNAEEGNAAAICPGYAPITEEGKTGTYGYGDVISTTDGWTQYIYEFNLKEETTICPLVRINKNSAPVLIDDFALIPENGNTTGINTVAGSTSSSDIYTLTGVKLQRPVKGLNIIGGRKVLVK